MTAIRDDDRGAVPRPQWTRTTSKAPQVYMGTDEQGRLWVWLGVPLGGEPARGGWWAEYRLANQNGRVIIAEVRVSPARWADFGGPRQSGEGAGFLPDDVPAGGLSARLLRRVTVGTHVDVMGELFEMMRRVGKVPEQMRGLRIGTWTGTGTPATVEEMIARRRTHQGRGQRGARPNTHRETEAKRAGRRPLSDDIVVEAAAAYLDARKQGSPHPVPDAARALGMSGARMRDLVYRARRRGLLTPTAQGRGGGALTPEARTLLSRVRRAQRKMR